MRSKRRIDRLELAPDALHVRRDRAVVDDDVGVAHQRIAVLHVAGKARERMHHPELGQREVHALAVPVDGEALQVERKRSALEDVLGSGRRGQQLAAAEQRGDARGEMRQARVLGEVVVGAEAQAGDDVEIAVARGEEDDRHRRRQRAQLAGQREAAVDVVAEADVDQREIGQPRAEGRQRLGAAGVRRDLVAVAAQRVRVVGADRGFVLDDGDAAAQKCSFALMSTIPQRGLRVRPVRPICHRFAIFLRRFAPFHPASRRNAGAQCAPWRRVAGGRGLQGEVEATAAAAQLAGAPTWPTSTGSSGNGDRCAASGANSDGCGSRAWPPGSFVSLVLGARRVHRQLRGAGRRQRRSRRRVPGHAPAARGRRRRRSRRRSCSPTCTWT